MKKMKFWLAGLAMLAAFAVQGQGWMKMYGGDGDHAGWEYSKIPRIVITPEGNYLIMGWLMNPNGSFIDSTVLIKVSPFGELIWQKNYADGLVLEGHDIISTPGGG